MADSVVERSPIHRVWLAVVDSAVSPSEISKCLGLTPTRELVKGLPTPPHSNGLSMDRIASFNRWELKIPIDDERPLQDHFAALEDILTESVIAGLRALSASASVRIEVEAIQDVGISIPTTLVCAIAKCGGEFDIDTGS